MAQKKPPLATVAFKVEGELAELLNQLPNRSEFIRKAIAAQLGITCPLCHGKAVVTGWTHDRFAELLKSLTLHPCSGCGDPQLVPADPSILGGDGGARMVQFVHGGPLYCDECYRVTVACGICQWRIDSAKLPEHMRSMHQCD